MASIHAMAVVARATAFVGKVTVAQSSIVKPGRVLFELERFAEWIVGLVRRRAPSPQR